MGHLPNVDPKNCGTVTTDGLTKLTIDGAPVHLWSASSQIAKYFEITSGDAHRIFMNAETYDTEADNIKASDVADAIDELIASNK